MGSIPTASKTLDNNRRKPMNQDNTKGEEDQEEEELLDYPLDTDCELCLGAGVYDVEDAQGNVRMVCCPTCYQRLVT